MNILVAEDAAVNAILLKNILERAGHRVIVTENGREALEVLETRPEIDLLAADIQMPEMDGITLVRELRSRPELEKLPVMFITSVSDAETVKAAVELKTAGYILKPILEPSRVVARVQAVLADSLQVLASPEEIIGRLGIDMRTYRVMLQALLVLVRGAAGGIASEDTRNTLRDSADQVGADRLVQALEVSTGNPGESSVLVRELKALSSELEHRGITLS